MEPSMARLIQLAKNRARYTGSKYPDTKSLTQAFLEKLEDWKKNPEEFYPALDAALAIKLKLNELGAKEDSDIFSKFADAIPLAMIFG